MGDQAVHRFFVDHRSAVLTSFFKLATHLGSSALLIPLVLVVGLLLWKRRGEVLPLAVLAASYAGALVLETSLKHLVGRARPPAADRLVHATGFALPSGHATLATAVWLTSAVVLGRQLARRRARFSVAAAAVCVIVAVDTSRVYLGVHWPTDVLAGTAIGGGWSALVLRLTARRPSPAVAVVTPPEAPVEGGEGGSL